MIETLLGLFPVAIPLTAIAIVQLQANGKMRPHEAASAGVLCVVILLGIGGWFLFELLGRKLPSRTRRRSYPREVWGKGGTFPRRKCRGSGSANDQKGAK